jgi:hypothetical protein
MKRRVLALLAIIAVVMVVAAFVVRFVEANLTPRPVLTHLARTPHQAYKFDLCLEAYALTAAGSSPAPDQTYKTDYTFQDPFRKADDTIIPTLMAWNQYQETASFQVIIIVGQVQTFTETISHVAALDGISVMLPDGHNHLQRSNQPQFIVSAITAGGIVAVLDYTCPQEWKWSAVT